MEWNRWLVHLLIGLWLVPLAAANPADPPAAEDEKQPGAIVEDLRAGDDERKRYFLIAPREQVRQPDDGFKLILVLPGGDGSADFHPFVRRIATNAVPPEFVVAHLVAPQWSPQQAEQFVWPTKATMLPEVKFSTQEFIDAVIDDVSRRFTIDPESIFIMAWSSSGQAAYAATLDEKSRVAGAFVAMSVFKPNELPDLTNAKGKAYYILHSPQDFIPMRFPEAARDKLSEHGGKTTLVTYEGGHGWRGDVYGMIRRGIDWLESETTKSAEAETHE